MAVPRFLLDEHISFKVARKAVRRGVDVAALEDLGLQGADDPTVMRRAIKENRILVT